MCNAKINKLASDVAQARWQRLDENQYRHMSLSKEAIEDEIRACISTLPAKWKGSAADLDNACITTDVVGLLIERFMRKFVARRGGLYAIQKDVFQDCWRAIKSTRAWPGPVVKGSAEREKFEAVIYHIVDNTAQYRYRQLRKCREATNTMHPTEDQSNSMHEAIDMIKIDANDEETEQLAMAFKEVAILFDEADIECEDQEFLLTYWDETDQPKTDAKRNKKRRLLERLRKIAVLVGIAAVVPSVASFLPKCSPEKVANPAIVTELNAASEADKAREVSADAAPAPVEAPAVLAWKSCFPALAFKSCRSTATQPAAQLAKSCFAALAFKSCQSTATQPAVQLAKSCLNAPSAAAA